MKVAIMLILAFLSVNVNATKDRCSNSLDMKIEGFESAIEGQGRVIISEEKKEAAKKWLKKARKDRKSKPDCEVYESPLESYEKKD